ncbi:MAG: D-Ala-D-Ala carboxypeptidase family metallohydrolase [Cyanobacteria bacterium P01_H01_bin.119]
MASLASDQRNYYYLIEAARTGIHKPILAGLYAVHQSPRLLDGETGLGIAPANQVSIAQVNTFPEQVQYAANTIRSITDTLTAQGWSGKDLWNGDAGRYSDRFVETIAAGYQPPGSDLDAARLETCDSDALLQAYIDDIGYDYRADQLAQNLEDLDQALLAFVERVAPNYGRLEHQREALLEMVRLWRKLDTQDTTIRSLDVPIEAGTPDLLALDNALVQFVRQVSRFYGGYPHQRESVLRLVQLWRQNNTREETIIELRNSDPSAAETNLQIVDPALIAFIERLPGYYQGRGDQRFALTEGFRLWKDLDSRSRAVETLGISPQSLTDSADNPQALAQAAAQIDRALLDFFGQVPATYQEQDDQREALIRLVQIWRKLESRTQAIQSLFDDLRRMAQAARDSQDAPPAPKPVIRPARPDRWTTNNIQLHATILPSGNFTWAEATRGGTRMPPNQTTVDAIVRIARLAQQARDRIGRPFIVTSWYRPPEINRQVGGAAFSRHIVGDAIDFYCEGLTGNQIYWALDPWWPGGLGRYDRFPALSHIDARGTRARWTNR